ncbi:MAG: hypothetical protein ACOYMS_09850, partial [Terrimicrobiaceae bacterium]
SAYCSFVQYPNSSVMQRFFRLRESFFKILEILLARFSTMSHVHSVLGGTVGRRSYRCGGLHLFRGSRSLAIASRRNSSPLHRFSW